MATIEDYYSSTEYTPSSSLTKKKGTDPKYWFMSLQKAKNGDVNDWEATGSGQWARKLRDAKKRATDKGMGDWSEAELKAFLKANFADDIKSYDGSSFRYQGENYTYPNIETASKDELFELAAAFTQIAKYKNTWNRKTKTFDNFNTQIDAFNKHREVVGKLLAGGGTVEQISGLLTNEDFNALEDYDNFIEKIDEEPDLTKNEWFINKYKTAVEDGTVQVGTTGTGGTGTGTTGTGTTGTGGTGTGGTGTGGTGTGGTGTGTTGTGTTGTGTTGWNSLLNPSTISVATADTNAQTAQTAATNTVLGDSSLEALRNYASENDLTLEEDPKNNSYVLKDADGNTVNKFAVDNDNNQIIYVGGEKDKQRFSVGGMPERADQMQDVEDTYFQEQQGLVDELGGLRSEYGDYMTSVVGGDINEGVAKQLGWTKTDTGWSDPDGNAYTVNEETGLLESDGVAATTKGTFEENDFAGQINAQLNQFLTGKDADGKDILDDEGNPIKGFLDYQSDLEDAAGTYKTDMTSLSGLYDQTYGDYANQLDPLRREMGDVRDRLGQVSEGQMEVARDASDRTYYNRLRDTLYADSADQLNRQTETGMDAIRQSFAASGADPTSPAFVAAMKDLQQSRSDAMVGARRKAILDSYGLGTQMLGNRSQALSGAGNALSSEMSGIGTEMGALDSLYGVKLEGLNTRRDMIGQIYGADKDVAATGISGLNTVLNTNLQGINADQTQFNTKLGLNKDFYNTQFQNLGLQFDALGNVRSTANQEGKDATDSILDFNQDLNSDKFNYITLENMFKDRDEEVPTWLKDALSDYGIK